MIKTGQKLPFRLFGLFSFFQTNCTTMFRITLRPIPNNPPTQLFFHSFLTGPSHRINLLLRLRTNTTFAVHRFPSNSFTLTNLVTNRTQNTFPQNFPTTDLPLSLHSSAIALTPRPAQPGRRAFHNQQRELIVLITILVSRSRLILFVA